MLYKVSFGSAFAWDQFGFMRKGTVHVDDKYLTYEGKKSWSTLSKLGIFLLITIVPLIFYGFSLGLIWVLIIIHYFCVSDSTIIISKSTIKDFQLKGKMIRFSAEHPETGKRKKGTFRAVTEDDAKSLEKEIQAAAL